MTLTQLVIESEANSILLQIYVAGFALRPID